MTFASPATAGQSAADRAVLSPGDALIAAKDLRHSFGHTVALAGATLAVAGGEILAIMGPSGSGKSTLLHCMAGIFIPDSGEVWFEGERIDTLGDARRTELRRTAFGFVFQFGQLVPELTVADNIALPLLLNRMRRKSAYAKAAAWLPRLGLDGLGDRRTGELSGGQAQRVALARALVAQPKLLFADEPTGSLDTLTGELVMDLLVSLAREEGTTVVLVTHDPRVAAYADREVLVRDGRIIDHAAALAGAAQPGAAQPEAAQPGPAHADPAHADPAHADPAAESAAQPETAR